MEHKNRYSGVTDEQGQFIGTVLVTIDVTKREKLARNLSSALERQAALYEAAQLITSAIALRNAKLYEEVTYLAEYDKLTGLLNRHSFERIFEEECKNTQSRLVPLTVLMLDVNELKKVNDQHGHLAGDLLIQAAAQVVKSSIRSNDFAFRYGGDEIVVLMPGITFEQAQIVIKRIEHNVKLWRKKKSQCRQMNLSISIGAADSNQVGLGSLLQEADKRMYENKKVYYRRFKCK